MSTATQSAVPSIDGPTTGPPRRTSLPTVVLLVLVVALTLGLAWWWRWTADDAFINFRAVRNVLDGNGPVFNAGERVEVGTSPLWLWLLAAGDLLLPVDVAWVAVVLGALGSAAGVLFACLGAIAVNRPRGERPARLFVPAGALVFLALPATWAFLTSGLETGLTFAWLGATWWGCARVAVAAVPVRPVWLLVVLGLAPLVRPDLALAAGLLGLWLLFAVRSSWPRRLRDVGIAALVPLGYEVFRMGWFGLLVPNTALAKESSRAVWARGWGYLADLVEPYHLYVPVLVCAALLGLTGWTARWDRRVLGLVAVTLAAAAVSALYVVRVGGDFMHGRLLLPMVFQALCPVAVVPVLAGVAWRRWVSAGLLAGLLAWCAVSATSLRISYPSAIGPDGFADERGVYVTASRTDNPVTLEDHRGNGAVAEGAQVDAAQRAGLDLVFNQTSRDLDAPDQLVPIGAGQDGTYFLLYQAGYLGYAVGSDVWVVDYFGLTDPIGAHLEPQPEGRPGHEKAMPLLWFWARYGVDLPTAPPAPEAVGRVTAPRVNAARDALGCGDLAELVAATSDPMSWGRFWDNLTGAVDRTSLRIPAAAHEARDLFC